MNAKSCLMPVTALLLVTVIGCGGTARQYQNVRIPPRLDLQQHEIIGLIEFDSKVEGELASLTSSRFVDMARRDQGLVRMIDLGTVEDVKHAVGQESWNPKTFQAIGRELNVQTILIGELKISDAKPNVKIAAALRSGSVNAEIDIVLEVQLIETATGASLWSRTAHARKSIGHISVGKGRPLIFDVENPELAYGDLVDNLVAQVTQDFHVSWVRRYY
jgi:hypothetical protein